jgi:hypothetical protein
MAAGARRRRRRHRRGGQKGNLEGAGRKRAPVYRGTAPPCGCHVGPRGWLHSGRSVRNPQSPKLVGPGNSCGPLVSLTRLVATVLPQARGAVVGDGGSSISLACGCSAGDPPPPPPPPDVSAAATRATRSRYLALDYDGRRDRFALASV